MKKVDMMAFLLTQKEMFTHDVAPGIPLPALDVCHLTAVPPIEKFFEMATIQAEVEWFKKQVENRGPKILLGLQHPPLDATPEGLKSLRRSGVVFTTLAYQKQNVFGAGFEHPLVGVTSQGLTFLDMLSESGMVLDLAHASHETARDALLYIESTGLPLPVAMTHGGCFGYYQSDRNLPNDVLEKIADRGGIVGIYTLTFGLHPSDNSIEPFLGHVEFALNSIGENAVAIGTDGIYRTLTFEQQAEIFQAMQKSVKFDGPFIPRLPVEPEPLNTPSKMEVLACALSTRFPSAVVEKIIGGNALRFLEENKLI